MKYITCEHDLKLYVPNMVEPVEGEQSVFDKLQPWLRQAETWLEWNVTGGVELPGDSRPLRDIVAYTALANALSALDLIMTPSGLGVVSTETIAPASQARTSQLRKDYIGMRDRAVIDTVRRLMDVVVWRALPVANIYLGSLMPVPDLTVYGVSPADDGRGIYETWRAYTATLDSVERTLAYRSISEPVLEEMRRGGFSTAWRTQIVAAFRQCAVDDIAGKDICRQTLERLTEMVRTNPESAMMWKASPTAELYTRPGYTNRKLAGGYFF